MTKKTVTSSPAKKPPSDTMNKNEIEKTTNNNIVPKITEVRKNNQSQFNSPSSVGSSSTRCSDSVSSTISYVVEMESSGSTTPTNMLNTAQAVNPPNKTYEDCLLTPVAGYSAHHHHHNNHHYDSQNQSYYSSPQQSRVLQYYQLQPQSPCTRLRSIRYSRSCLLCMA